MSTGSRARALEYAKTTRSIKNDGRQRAMPNNFGKPSPSAVAGNIADAQLIAKDDKSAETKTLRHEEESIRNDSNKDSVDSTDFKPPANDGQAPPPLRTTTNDPAAVVELRSAFGKCWTTVDEFDIPSITHYDKSSYTPLGLNLFQILFAMEDVLNGNDELRWISPMYFSLPVRVYYSVIFFVQTLRAKEASGTLSKPDSSFLRAFLRRFKDTSCVIAGPLVPYFTNVTACLPDDKQFDTVTPSLPIKGTYSVSKEGSGGEQKQVLNVDPLHHILPSVPLVGSLLRLFCTTNDLTPYFADNGEFVPVPDTGGEFAGITFPAKQNGTWTHEFAQIVNNPAMMRPLPESEFRLREIHPHWKRSGVRHFPNITTTTPFDPQGPSAHTQLVDNFNWFEVCINMAAIQARFFSDSSNLSQIPVLGGRSTLVVSNIQVLNPEDGTPTRRPTTVDGWYPDTFSFLKSSFEAFTAVLHLDDKYNAIFALSNGTLNWETPAGSKIGSNDSGHRNGPYWNNDKKTFELAYPREVSTGLFNMIQTLFYSAKPSGT